MIYKTLTEASFFRFLLGSCDRGFSSVIKYTQDFVRKMKTYILVGKRDYKYIKVVYVVVYVDLSYSLLLKTTVLKVVQMYPVVLTSIIV